eukprot:TRINITY_DN10326_c0_g1_i1.p1 TRINITY_DN10326_c0_g1~~TRINITY_DN10326_c0_g1_i1.p1  ORF type:complete len:532 (-),score=68.50 TRINITY_DN10326_c0_g1_i1:111-1706(-)
MDPFGQPALGGDAKPQIYTAPVIAPGSLIGHACSFCKQRKLKCDMKSPCGNCSKRSMQCFYVERLPGKKRGPKPKGSVDAGIVARIIPREDLHEGLAYLIHEVAKLKAEVASLRTEQVTQSKFSLETETFLSQTPAFQLVVQEFVNTVSPVLSWYTSPDPQQLLLSWNSLLRDSAANISETLKVYYEPDSVSRNFEAAAIFSLTCGLMHKPDLAEHFEDICQTFLQTIFFKREAKLSAPSLRRVGSALMLIMFRFMSSSKPVATRYIGSFLLEVASQLDSQGAPDDAELLYAISTRVAAICMESQTTSQWVRRINAQASGRSFTSVLEFNFFEVFNKFVSREGTSPDVIHRLLIQIESTAQLIRDQENVVVPRLITDDALRYYTLWFMMLRAEAYLRLGRRDLIGEILSPAQYIIPSLPKGLTVALIGLTKFASTGPNGPGLMIAPILSEKMELLVRGVPKSPESMEEILLLAQPQVSSPSEDSSSESTTVLSPLPSSSLDLYISPETSSSQEQPVSPSLAALYEFFLSSY